MRLFTCIGVTVLLGITAECVLAQQTSIAAKIEEANAKRGQGYTVRGDLSVEKDGQVRIQFTKDDYALVRAEQIDAETIFPLAQGEDPSGRGSKHAFKLNEGAEVELHVGELTHRFKLAKGARPFVIDPNDPKVVYLDEARDKDKVATPLSCEYDCRKWVIVADIYCCGGGFTQGGYGYVGCADEWCDEDRCCD